MGYTHYWYINPETPQDQYKEAVASVQKLIDHGVQENIIEKPTLKDKIENPPIFFNGIGQESHETFVLLGLPKDYVTQSFVQKNEQGFVFDFCKTQRKPYDTYVTAALSILKHFLKENIFVSSDGRPQDFIKGTVLAGRILNLEIQNPNPSNDG